MHPHDYADGNLIDVLPTDGTSRLKAWVALQMMGREFRRGIIQAVKNGVDVTFIDDGGPFPPRAA